MWIVNIITLKKNSANVYLFKVYNGKTRTKLIIKASEQRHLLEPKTNYLALLYVAVASLEKPARLPSLI